MRELACAAQLLKVMDKFIVHHVQILEQKQGK